MNGKRTKGFFSAASPKFPRALSAAVVWAVGISGGAGSAALAIPIYPGAVYESTISTGYKFQTMPYAPGGTVGNGMGIAVTVKYAGGADLGQRATFWDASGAPAIELGNLGVDSTGHTATYATAINPAGTAVGMSYKYTAGTLVGSRAVRWDASGFATELGNLGTDVSGSTSSLAYAVNAFGTAVGFAKKYGPNGEYLDSRAVRWNSSSTAAAELGNLGTDSNGVTVAQAFAVSVSGTAVGYARKFTANVDKGPRAVRWDPSGTVPTELGNLGTSSSGFTGCYAYAVNPTGTAIGVANKYVGGVGVGNRAVRWDASGTVATELGNLGTDFNNITDGEAYGINAAGTVVGYMEKYTFGLVRGVRAVRWDAGQTVATELGNLGSSADGKLFSRAYAINASGIAVGYAEKYTAGIDDGPRAVAWGSDGVAIDLNTLLAPSDALKWTLTEARGISDTNWVSGYGNYDPDGTGNLPSYQRGFLIQVPEPTSMMVVLSGVSLLSIRRRSR